MVAMRATTMRAGRGAARTAGGQRIRCRGGALSCVAKVREVFMPALSSTMTEGTIVEWLKSEGDTVTKGESLLVVASDKADMVVESFNDGLVGAIAVQAGETAQVGSAIAFLAESEEELGAAKEAAGGGGAAAPPAPAADPEPAAPAAPAPAAAAAAPPPPPPPPAAATPAPPSGRVYVTPYAKKLAKKLKVDLGAVTATGPHGRIVAADVERAAGVAVTPAVNAPPVAAPAAAAPPSASAPASASAAASPSLPSPPASAADKAGKTEKFSAMQSAVSKNMVDSLAVPEFRVSMTIGTGKLDALYKKIKPAGVTMTALISKAVAVALRSHPVLYASCTGDGIHWNENINVACAVAMDGGLITPVLQNADNTDIYQLSRDWRDLVKRARAKKLAPAEFSTGTFTISNLGMFGVDSFDAILPPGQAGILAVGGSKDCVVSEGGMIGVKRQMTVNLTADHRIVYGADAAEFLQTLKAVIEEPDVLLM